LSLPPGGREISTQKLHKRRYTLSTRLNLQVELNGKRMPRRFPDAATTRAARFPAINRVVPGGTPWTDDRAPVEWVMDKMLAEQIARGQGLDERYLPAAPP
jgi:hypothetical protein